MTEATKRAIDELAASARSSSARQAGLFLNVVRQEYRHWLQQLRDVEEFPQAQELDEGSLHRLAMGTAFDGVVKLFPDEVASDLAARRDELLNEVLIPPQYRPV